MGHFFQLSTLTRSGRLIEFDGRPIHSANDFANILGVYPAFWPVTVTFEHEGQVLTKRVRLERLTVPMEKPFEVDERINTRETQRVLQACRDRLGVLPEGKRLTWRGECREHVVERDEESVTISEYTGRELSRDRQELTLKDVFTGKTRTYVCTGRDAIVELAVAQTQRLDAAFCGQAHLGGGLGFGVEVEEAPEGGCRAERKQAEQYEEPSGHVVPVHANVSRAGAWAWYPRIGRQATNCPGPGGGPRV